MQTVVMEYGSNRVRRRTGGIAAEVRFDESAERFDGEFGVRALGLDFQDGTAFRSERDQVEQALAVDLFAFVHINHANLGHESGRSSRE